MLQIEAMTLTTKIAVFRAGEVQQVGTPDAIYYRFHGVTGHESRNRYTSCIPMIRHCVFIHFKADITTEHRNALFNEIVELQSHLTGILDVHIGRNVSPEKGMDKGYTDGFMVDFTDAQARDDYLVNEAHQYTGTRLVEAAQGGAEGILVYDLEIA